MHERRAVVIGINNYSDPAVRPELKGAENDAREVFARLKRFGQFDIDKRHLLLGKAANCDSIRRAISDLFWKKDPCEIVVFYFSGHGYLDDYGNGYLAPWDHDYKDPLVHGIRMQELRQYFLANNNKAEALLILDCCHSGVTAEPTKGAGDLTGRFYEPLTNSQAAVMASGKFILASSGADEKSREISVAHGMRIFDKDEEELAFDDLEKHDHGIMTYHLLEGMDGGAADGDKVSIGRLFNYVRDKVSAYRDEVRNDYKIYDCVYSAYEEGASQTMLVNASCKNTIETTLTQVEANINTDAWKVPDKALAASEGLPEVVVHPNTLLEAIREIELALNRSPESSAALRLVKVVDVKLTEYRDYVGSWMPNRNTYMTRDYREEFGLLQDVVSDLCFNSLRKLDKAQGNLVVDFLCLTMGQGNQKPFAQALKYGPFTRAQNKTGGITKAAPASGGSIK